MIDLLPAVPSVLPVIAAPVAVVDGASAMAGRFERTLSAFLDANGAALEEPGVPAPAAERQDAADPGKDLPVVTAGDDAVAIDAVALPFWFAALPAPAPIPAPPALATSEISNGAVITRAEADPAILQTPRARNAAEPPNAATRDQMPAAPRPVVEQVVAPAPAPAPTPGIVVDPRASAVLHDVSMSVADGIQPRSGLVPQPASFAPTPTPPTPAPTTPTPPNATPSTSTRADITAQAISVSAIPQPAGQVFASARASAGSWRERGIIGPRDEWSDTTVSFAGLAPIDLRDRAIVHAADQTNHAALDLTADPGLQRMIDRIETLRDAASDSADTRDTRVRLIPDALGSIEVAVRQDGDRVHVRFTAENDATRVLIADAQPRLTELAAARGVRIGDTSVSTGTGSGGTVPQPRHAQPPATRRAPLAVASDIDPITDHRLA